MERAILSLRSSVIFWIYLFFVGFSPIPGPISFLLHNLRWHYSSLLNRASRSQQYQKKLSSARIEGGLIVGRTVRPDVGTLKINKWIVYSVVIGCAQYVCRCSHSNESGYFNCPFWHLRRQRASFWAIIIIKLGSIKTNWIAHFRWIHASPAPTPNKYREREREKSLENDLFVSMISNYTKSHISEAVRRHSTPHIVWTGAAAAVAAIKPFDVIINGKNDYWWAKTSRQPLALAHPESRSRARHAASRTRVHSPIIYCNVNDNGWLPIISGWFGLPCGASDQRMCDSSTHPYRPKCGINERRFHSIHFQNRISHHRHAESVLSH